MRLMSIQSGSHELCRIIDGERVVDVPTVGGLQQFLEFPDWRTRASALLASDGTAVSNIDLDSQHFAPLIASPHNIIVVGANTHSHLKEAEPYTGAVPPKRPMILAKSPGAMSGHRDPIVYPPETDSLDYEVELAVVIGTRARRVAPEDALSVIAGYTVANDVSARNVQLSDWEDNTFYRTHYLGKSFDGFCPCGPQIVTPDEVGPLGPQRMRSWVNGELRQDSTLDDLYFSVEHLVSYVSQVLTLQPGDIILTGSPAGVGAFHEKGYVHPGDIVRCEIEGIGVIENLIVAEQ
jgi:2-keto-4-pentenoate hydratase/2-oxohepta-3-ene-1,7-dioic acid hydratase in catechol pathway